MNYDVVVKCSSRAERDELTRDLAAAGFAFISRPKLAAAERLARAKAPPVAPMRLDSEGQRLLRELPGTTRVLAARLGVSAMTISSWRRGATSPEEDDRARLEALCGIDRRAWSFQPGAKLPPRK